MDFTFCRHTEPILLYLDLPFLLDNCTLFCHMWCLFFFLKVCFILLWKKLCLFLLCCHLFLALIFLTHFHTTLPIFIDTPIVSLGVHILISCYLHQILIPPSHKEFALEIFCWLDFLALIELWTFLPLSTSSLVRWIACLFLLGYYACFFFILCDGIAMIFGLQSFFGRHNNCFHWPRDNQPGTIVHPWRRIFHPWRLRIIFGHPWRLCIGASWQSNCMLIVVFFFLFSCLSFCNSLKNFCRFF